MHASIELTYFASNIALCVQKSAVMYIIMNVATLSCVVVWCDVLCCCGVMYVVWGTNIVVVLWYAVLLV